MERDPVRLTIGWPRGSQAGIGRRKGAGPPSGMYYGASGTSVRAGGVRASPGLLGGGWGSGARRARAERTGFPTCSFRAARGVRELGRVHSEARARNRPPGGRARAGRPRSRGRASSALSPAPPPFSIWVSFFPFFLLFFFSMNTHRVHLKATRPHFTASVALLPRVPLRFNAVSKKEETNINMRQNRGFGGSGPYFREELNLQT